MLGLDLRRYGRLCLLVFLLISCVPAYGATDANSSTPPQITIIRKAGREDGVAALVVKGKVRKITPHAMQAWTVRNGRGALVLVVEHGRSSAKKFLLRYYDLESGRRRVLGEVPFQSAELQESKPDEEEWAFALTGNNVAGGQIVTVVGDDEAVPGVLAGASQASFAGDDLTVTAGGETHTFRTANLLGTDLRNIYSAPQSHAGAFQYFQIFPDATALTVSDKETIHRGRWHTDGKNILLNVADASLSIPHDSLQKITGVPAGTRFSVRLLQPLSSQTAKEGMTVKAMSITPIVVDGEILVPQGTSIEGTVTKMHGVGWGFRHETAAMTIVFQHATLADGRTLDITARVFQVENAQEKVDAEGKIKGIRSTATPGNSVENGVLSFAGIDPIAYIFASAAGSGVLGFAESEILYKAGTELILEYTKPLITAQSYPPVVGASAATTEARQQLQDFVKELPFRTRTKGSNKVSDLTNLVFMGDPEALHRAFLAAGWLPTDDLNSTSTFKTLKTLSGNQTYTQAPMSILLLDERAPIFALSKTTNTFSSRHHVRVFPTEEKWNGITTETASSTQDIGIAFSRKQKTFIHIIDPHLDNERSKIINDLKFTGCVDSVDMIPRPWLPTDAYNSTGDRLLTDRDAAVLHINACTQPRTTPDTAPLLPNRFERITRDTSLTIRNNLYRGNLIYQGISGGFAVRNYLRSSNELPKDYGAWRKADTSGATYAPLRSTSDAGDSAFGLKRRRRAAPGELDTDPADLAAMASSKATHKWDPPRYEFALEGGYLHFHSTDLSYVDLLTTSPTEPTQYELDLFDSVDDGWAAGGSVTINSWRYLSNEFSYFRQQGKYLLNAGQFISDPQHPEDDDFQLDANPTGLTTRQFEYNLLIHVRPPASRWRPYVAAGPAFQLIALSDSPLKKPAGIYTLGLKNIGLLKAAFDFGNTAPLDGGGIFEFGLQYGAGLKYRVTPHTIVRADFRETWSKNPDIIRNSYQDYVPTELDASYTTDIFKDPPPAKFFQDRFTIGVAFAF
ncbi:MAG: LssY C-terminal domain-containing protein [Acidobacteriota bacterium]|nr:LssY C-terminal domain-containing protein [Acidobacteriota bacterium]